MLVTLCKKHVGGGGGGAAIYQSLGILAVNVSFEFRNVYYIFSEILCSGFPYFVVVDDITGIICNFSQLYETGIIFNFS